MNAKEFLKSIKKLDLKMENKVMEILSLYDLVESATIAPKEINVQTSGGEDRFADTMVKIIDLKKELEDQLFQYINLKLKAIEMIDSMETDEFANILMRRYINYESWNKIAKDLGYTRQGIDYKHGKALVEFQRVLTRFDIDLQ